MSVFYQDRQEHFRLFLSENNRFPSHLHRQAEGIFVLSGSLRVTVGEESREMKKGQYFFIFPHQIHSLYTGRAAGYCSLSLPPACARLSPGPFLPSAPCFVRCPQTNCRKRAGRLFIL